MDFVFEMHGRIFDVKCTSCDYCVEDLTNPLCPALDVSHIKDYNDAGTKQIDIPLKELPRCPACHALARLGVVWFGETPYQLAEIDRLLFKADMCLVVGTSSTVGIHNNIQSLTLTDRYVCRCCRHLCSRPACRSAEGKSPCSTLPPAPRMEVLTLFFGAHARQSSAVFSQNRCEYLDCSAVLFGARILPYDAFIISDFQ